MDLWGKERGITIKIRYRCNFMAGIVSVLFGLAIVLITPGQVNLGYGQPEAITPRTLPYCLGGLCIILGCALIFQSLVLKKDTVRELDVKKEIKALAYIAVLFLYVSLFKLSFILASVFLGAATLLFLRCKKVLHYGIIIAMAVILYVLFTQVLHVRM